MSENPFADLVLAHNRAPIGRERLASPTFTARGANPLCGDDLTLDGRIEGNVVRELGYAIDASALTLASTSLMVSLCQGRELDAVRTLCGGVLRYLSGAGSPPLAEIAVFDSVLGYRNRLKTLTLPWATLLRALDGQLQTSTDSELTGGSN